MGKGTSSAVRTTLEQSGLPNSAGRTSMPFGSGQNLPPPPQYSTGRTSMPSFSYQQNMPPPQQYGYGSPYPGVSSRPIYQPNQPRYGSPTIGIDPVYGPPIGIPGGIDPRTGMPTGAPIGIPGGIDPRTGMPNFGLGALNIPRYPVYQQPRNPYVRMPTYTPPAYSFPTPEQLWRRPTSTPVTTPTTPTTPTEPQQPDPGPSYSSGD